MANWTADLNYADAVRALQGVFRSEFSKVAIERIERRLLGPNGVLVRNWKRLQAANPPLAPSTIERKGSGTKLFVTGRLLQAAGTVGSRDRGRKLANGRVTIWLRILDPTDGRNVADLAQQHRRTVSLGDRASMSLFRVEAEDAAAAREELMGVVDEFARREGLK